MRVLLTNIGLAWRSGTEIVTRDLALGLARRGHDVVVYTPKAGEIADEIWVGGVPVVATLDGVEPPDVIHAHHSPQCAAAVLRFPDRPVVFVCHDARAWHDEAPLFPQIRRYVAVDTACRDRLLADGVEPDRIALVPNAVDLDRFRPREPLPASPRRAAVFSNSAAHVPAVRGACERHGIELELVGAADGALSARPEELLGPHDIVFAKGRSALEAAAVGCAVVLCDAGGLGPMVRLEQLDALRALNLGFRTFTDPVESALVAQRIADYDAGDAARVSARVRDSAGLDGAVASYVELYESVLRAHVPADLGDTVAAAARWVEGNGIRLNQHDEDQRQLHAAEAQLEAVRTAIARIESSALFLLQSRLVQSRVGTIARRPAGLLRRVLSGR